MTTTATLVQLAAELTLFLVALAGAGLSLRHGLLGLDRAARMLLVVGFTVLGATAFLVGSLTLDRTADPVALAAVRVAGAAIVALGALRWAGSRLARPALLGGLALLAGAAVAEAQGAQVGDGGVGAEPLVLAAGLVMGGALVVAGRHTIPGRIGTSVAGVLLAVILLISVALSTVISATVEDEALRREGVQAAAEADAARREAEAALDEATLAAASLAAGRPDQLVALATDPAGPEAAAALDGLASALTVLTGPDGLAVAGPVVVVGPTGAPEVAVPASLGGAARLALGGDPVVEEARQLDAPRQGVTSVGTQAFALAAAPLRVEGDGGRTTAGVLVVGRPLDPTFLRRQGSGAGEGRALVTREGVVAAVGPQPSAAVVTERAEGAIETDSARAGVVDGRIVVARPVGSEGLPPEMALVLSSPTDRVGRTREDIYRSLFLVALAAGLAGMALATVLGERIGGGIRRLTAAAARIREGDLDARAAVDREDELGELSTTFDAMAGSLRGLTGDLREAAASEARLRSRLETVFAGVTEAVVAADGEGRVTEANRSAEELLGRERADLVDRSLLEVVALRDVDGGAVSLHHPDDGTRAVAGDLAPAGGDPVPVVGTVAPLRDERGAPAGTVVVLRDVRREQALEAAKRDFLANIGHELRTPLTPIKGYAGVLRRRTPSPDQARAWADGITTGVTRLEHLVDRLVAFSALSAGAGAGGRPPAVPIDAAALVDDVVRDWAARLDGDRVVEAAGSSPGADLAGDPALLRLALDELVDNATRFSPSGTPVWVEAAVEEDPGEGRPRVALTVHDEGRSDAAVLEEAVTAFRQGDASATRARDGLGLGLALSERIAAAHGGRLRIVAPSARGTSVSILVPMVTPCAPGADDEPPVPLPSGGAP